MTADSCVQGDNFGEFSDIDDLMITVKTNALFESMAPPPTPSKDEAVIPMDMYDDEEALALEFEKKGCSSVMCRGLQ